MPMEFGLFFGGILYSILYFIFAWLAVALYNRYVFRKRFTDLEGSFRGLTRFGLAALMAPSAGFMIVVSFGAVIYYAHKSDPYNNTLSEDFNTNPLVYPYLLYTPDSPPKQVGHIDVYDRNPLVCDVMDPQEISNQRWLPLCSVKEIGVEQNYIIGRFSSDDPNAVAKYFLLNASHPIVNIFDTREELELAWKTRVEFTMPVLATPGEYYAHYRNNNPSKLTPTQRLIGLLKVVLVLTSFTLAPLFWIALAHIYYRRKNRRLQARLDTIQGEGNDRPETSELDNSGTLTP